MPLVTLADAGINLVSTSRGLGRSIVAEFDEVEQGAKRSGGRISSNLFGGLRGTLSKELAPAPAEAEDTGRKVGSKLGGGFAATLKSAVGPALAVFSAGAITSFGKQSVGAFSELEDSTAAASVVFGDSMQKIVTQASGASKQMGLTKQQVINAANTFGTYGKAAGLSGDALADFATEQTQLASDMASFKGTSPEQAIEAIGAALRGETEPIRAYGVMLDDASLRQKALAMGLISTTKEALTPQNKTLAAQALIMEQTADAQGDFARTSTSTANIQKTLSAATADVSAKFGQVLAPAFTAARTRALSTVEGVSALLDRVLAFQSALGEGATTPVLVQALGLDPSQGFGLAVNEGIGSIYAFGAAWKTNDGDVTSSGFPGFAEKAGYQARQLSDSLAGLWSTLALGDWTGPIFGQEEDSAFAANLFKIRDAATSLTGGDFSQLQPLFTSIMAVARPAAPLMVEVGKGIGGLSGEIGKLVAGALPLAIPLLQGATSVMNYLAENTGVLTGVIIALGAGYVAVKAATVAATVADLLRVPLLATQAAANLTLASAIRAQTAAQATNTTVGEAALGNRRSTTAALAASTVATTATTAATGGLTVAQGVAAVATRALGFAVKALPFVGLLAILASVVAGIVLFFTETELGRQIVQNAWAGIQVAVGAVVSWFQKTVLPIAQQVFAAIGTAASWLYTNVIQPAFSGIQAAAGWVVGAFQNALAVAQPVFSGIGVVLNSFWMLASKIFEIVVAIVTKVLIPAFMSFWQGTIVPVFAAVGSVISSWWDRAQLIFGLVVAFVRNTLGGIFTWFRDSVISPVFDFVSGVIDRQVRGWTIIFQVLVDFFNRTLGPIFTWLYENAVKPAMDKVGGIVSSVYDKTLKPIFDGIADIIQNKVPKAFELGVSAAGKWFKGLEDLAKAPIRFVVETVLNDGLIANVNKLAEKVGVDPLPDIALPAGFHRGGIIPGRDPGKRDNVLTPMRSQEGVLVPEAATGLGHSVIHALNRAGNTGGVGAVRRVVEGMTGAAKQKVGLGAPQPGSEPYIWGGPQMAAKRAGAMNFHALGAFPMSMLQRAAGAWQGLSGLAVNAVKHVGSGWGQNSIGVRHGGMANPNWIGYYQGQEVSIKPGGPNELATLVHEIGHAVGINHNTGNTSVMHPYLGSGGGALWPTAYDQRNLQTIYGPPGSGGRSAGDGKEGGSDGKGLLDTILGPFKDIANGLIDSIRTNFPGAGTFIDLAVGAGKEVLTVATKWMSDKIGALKDIASDIWDGAKKILGFGQLAPQSLFPTLYDNGGVVPPNGGRPQLIQNKTRKPELLHTTAQLAARDQFVAAQAQASMGGGWFEGQLVLDSGELMGTIRGEVRRGINDAASQSRYTRVGR